MKKLKWVLIGAGLYLLKRGLKYRISEEQKKWLQSIPNAELTNRDEFIISTCAGKTILHIGFADSPFTESRMNDGSLLHLKLKMIARKIWGTDIDNDSVELYKRKSGDTNVSAVKIEDLQNSFFSEYEIIVAGEILEHLIDPQKMIDELYRKMYLGQYLVVSVPNTTSLDSIAASLNQTESIHPDHQWYFSPYTLLNKFSDGKWSMVDFKYALYDSRKPEGKKINPLLSKFPNLSDCLVAVMQKK